MVCLPFRVFCFQGRRNWVCAISLEGLPFFVPDAVRRKGLLFRQTTEILPPDKAPF